MQNEDFERSIARCQVLVHHAQDGLERSRQYDLADSLVDVLNRLPTFISKIKRSDQEINSIRQKFESERKARIDAQQREQALLEKVKLDGDSIKKQLATIRTLNNELAAAKLEAKKQFEKGYKAGEQAERNRHNQPDSDFEDLIRRQLVRGSQKFNAYDFAGALALLKEAQSSILSLPAARRQVFDNTKLRYQIAICGAYVNDLAAAEKSLFNFAQATFSTASSKEEMLNLAHAQHLLAQVYIGQNKITDALSIFRRSNEIRWQYLAATDNRRYQSAALSARLLELTGAGDASLAREAIHDISVRKALKAAYAKLKPLQAGINPQNEPYILVEPATELLPIWTMKAKAKKAEAGSNKPDGNKQDNPKPTSHPPTVEPFKRGQWLTELKLENSKNENLDAGLDQAIRSGDRQRVSQILTTYRPRPVAPALHMAALFNEVEIAKMLIQHGASPLEACDAKTESGKDIFGVLPMHCAVGAQNEEMIRLLHKCGANFKAAGSSRPAPPLWLMSDRWLKLTGKDDSASVLKILQTMKELGWRKEDGLNKKDDKMVDLADRLKGRSALKAAVLEYLKRN